MTTEELIQQLEGMERKITKLELEACHNRVPSFSRIRKRLHRRVLIPVGILFFFVAATFTFAATIPNSFTSGDPISASQMNENFSYLIERLWEVTGANLYYSAGNVGIGTSSPSQKLEVVGTVDADAFTVNGTPVGTSTSSYWNKPAADLYYNSGNVGIGTVSPSEKLDVSGNLAVGNGTNLATIDMRDVANASWRLSTTGFKLSFLNNNGGTFNEKTVILNDGSVGIGTTAPAYKLDVAGDINTTGDIRKSGTTYTNPDYVFEPNYKLMPMDELTSFLDKNRHLPGMPSTKTVKKTGVRLFEQNRLILEKLEEAYLYIIEQNHRIEDQDRRLAKLEATLSEKLY